MLMLACASFFVTLSTERAKQRYFRGLVGWLLAGVLALAGVFLFAQQWGLAVAVSAAVLCLMAGLPLIASVLGWQARREQRHAR